VHFFSFRNRLVLNKIGIYLLIGLSVLFLAMFLYLSFMERYVVYERDGVHIDTAWQENITSPKEKVLLNTKATVTELKQTTTGSGSVRQLSGIYVSLDMLKNIDRVRNTIIDGGYKTVLMEVKAVSGNFYYNTSIEDAPLAGTVNTDAVTNLIQELRSMGCYMIASIPAFADRAYLLNHTDIGLPLRSGVLWTDEYNCYWMNPVKDGTLERTEVICRELNSLGFQEILLRNFYFPSDEKIYFDESIQTKSAALANFVMMLQSEMNTEDVTISFGINNSYGFPATISSGRLYITTNDGKSVDKLVSTYRERILSPETQIVFIADSRDTRFDEYGHLVPAIATTVE